MDDIYSKVPGQEAALSQLRAAAKSPVHAYLFVGPPGTGKRAAARAFAASLICPKGGCGECSECRRVLAGIHPDAVLIERTGPFIAVDEAREVARLAVRSPAEANRQVLMLADFHLVERAGPALLKTIEEPPPTTYFVILADYLAEDLVTIASRCARVDFAPLAVEVIEQQLKDEGIDASTASSAAKASGGRLDRARLLASDPGSMSRRSLWYSVPARLDGTGATAAALADELMQSCESVLSPVRAQQERELEELAEQAGATGEHRIPGRRYIDERHRREQRRARTDELRYGLAVLAGSYRDRLEQAAARSPVQSLFGAGASAAPSPLSSVSTAACLESLEIIQEVTEALVRNPNETLLLQAMLVKLSRVASDGVRLGTG